MDWKNYLELSDENLDDIRYIGYLYIKQGCYDIAYDFFKALSVITPDNAYDFLILGSLHLQKEEYQEALKYLDKSIKIQPNNYLTRLNKTKTLFSLGYKNEGLKQAKIVANCRNKNFSTQAEALITSYH